MDRNGKDVKETEQTKKRWKGYTEKLYQKKTQKTKTRNLNDPYNHKAWSLTQNWTSLSLKSREFQEATTEASGGDGNPAGLFKILKDDVVEVLHSISQQIWKTHQWPEDWKMSVFIPIPKKGNAKECSNYCKMALISHARKVMFKIIQTRFQQYVNRELPDVQARFRKGRRRVQIANIHWRIEKAREFQKNIYFCFIDQKKAKSLTVWITTNCGKFLKR